MIISGIQKTTFIDYPGHIASTIFLAGCNFRCPFCHNRNLVLNDEWLEKISTEEILEFLAKRKKYADGVCITGGEPLIHKELPEFLHQIKKIGLEIKLDTNGTNPEMLGQLYEDKLIDFVAFDIKSSLKKYPEISQTKISTEKLKEDIFKSIKLVMNSGLPYEFRSTILPHFHDAEEVELMAKLIKGAKTYYLQKFVPRNTVDKTFMDKEAFTDKEMKQFSQVAGRYVENCEVR